MDNYQFVNLGCQKDGLEKIKEAIKNGMDIEAYDKDPDSRQQTILHNACLYKRNDIVKYLLEQGADVNSVDSWDNTPLQFALDSIHSTYDDCTICYNVELLTMLLEHGADINFPNSDKETPLDYAPNFKAYKFLKNWKPEKTLEENKIKNTRKNKNITTIEQLQEQIQKLQDKVDELEFINKTDRYNQELQEQVENLQYKVAVLEKKMI